MASIIRFLGAALARFSRIRPAFAALAVALFAVCAPASASEPVFVWYRSSEGCPEARVFLAKLTERAARARLAAVGDRIDFVVTLGRSEDGASGRLERQTERGTVAIRELRGARCESVAEALALTLALTVDSDASPNEPSAEGAAKASRPEALRAAAMGADWGDEGTLPESENAVPARPWKVGLYSSGTTLAERRLLLGGGAFLEWQRQAVPAFSRRSLRLTVHGGIVPEAASNVGIWILAGRVDVSPFALGTRALQLRPAAALDLGLISAQNRVADQQDRAFWAALSALLRLAWQPRDNWGLEAEVGLLFPLTRYELRGAPGQPRISRVDALGITAGLAATFELP